MHTTLRLILINKWYQTNGFFKVLVSGLFKLSGQIISAIHMVVFIPSTSIKFYICLLESFSSLPLITMGRSYRPSPLLVWMQWNCPISQTFHLGQLINLTQFYVFIINQTIQHIFGHYQLPLLINLTK